MAPCTHTPILRYNTFTAQGDFEMKVRSIALALYTAFSIAVTIALWVIIADTTATGFKVGT